MSSGTVNTLVVISSELVDALSDSSLIASILVVVKDIVLVVVDCSVKEVCTTTVVFCSVETADKTLVVVGVLVDVACKLSSFSQQFAVQSTNTLLSPI